MCHRRPRPRATAPRSSSPSRAPAACCSAWSCCAGRRRAGCSQWRSACWRWSLRQFRPRRRQRSRWQPRSARAQRARQPPLVRALAAALRARARLAACLPAALACASRAVGIDTRGEYALVDDAQVAALLREAEQFAKSDGDTDEEDVPDSSSGVLALVANDAAPLPLAAHVAGVAAAQADVVACHALLADLAAAPAACAGGIRLACLSVACRLRNLLAAERSLVAAAVVFLERCTMQLSAHASGTRALALDSAEAGRALTSGAAAGAERTGAEDARIVMAAAPLAATATAGSDIGDIVSAAVLEAARATSLTHLVIARDAQELERRRHAETMAFAHGQRELAAARYEREALARARADEAADARLRAELAAHEVHAAQYAAEAAENRRLAADLAVGQEACAWARERANDAHCRAMAGRAAFDRRCWAMLSLAMAVATATAAARAWPLIARELPSLACACSPALPPLPPPQLSRSRSPALWLLLPTSLTALWRGLPCVCWAQIGATMALAAAAILYAVLPPRAAAAMAAVAAAVFIRPLAAAAFASVRARAAPLALAATMAAGIVAWAPLAVLHAGHACARDARGADIGADYYPWSAADSSVAAELEIDLARRYKAERLAELARAGAGGGGGGGGADGAPATGANGDAAAAAAPRRRTFGACSSLTLLALAVDWAWPLLAVVAGFAVGVVLAPGEASSMAGELRHFAAACSRIIAKALVTAVL